MAETPSGRISGCIKVAEASRDWMVLLEGVTFFSAFVADVIMTSEVLRALALLVSVGYLSVFDDCFPTIAKVFFMKETRLYVVFHVEG